MPATQSDEGPLGKYARADGSLREEYTEPRHTEGNDPSSMLPDADEVYLATAATTAEDLAAAAPSVPEETRAEIAALDPTLDQDVADWFDESSPRPKVHLLGPVAVTALNGGDPTAIDNARRNDLLHRLPGLSGPRGHRGAGRRGVRVEDPEDGSEPGHQRPLPVGHPARRQRLAARREHERRRPPGHQPDLRARPGDRRGAQQRRPVRAAEAPGPERRGDNGCEEDLVTALSLVTGAPFEAATEHRFKWLFKPGQQRHDEILVGAIHDAAHILATRAVAEGRTDLVRLACDAARKASPHSDIAWLDLGRGHRGRVRS